MDKLKLNDRMELLNIDASKYVPEYDDRDFYFFNPFTGSVLEGCLQNIVDTHDSSNPRVLLYANPNSDDIFQKYFTKTQEYIINPGQVRVYRYEKI